MMMSGREGNMQRSDNATPSDDWPSVALPLSSVGRSLLVGREITGVLIPTSIAPRHHADPRPHMADSCGVISEQMAMVPSRRCRVHSSPRLSVCSGSASRLASAVAVDGGPRHRSRSRTFKTGRSMDNESADADAAAARPVDL